MAETFKCPSCSAPLEFEGKPIQKCRFCGSNVIVPNGVMRDSSSFGSAGNLDFSDLSALTGNALKIAEIQGLIQSGQKIQAIKVFRETFGSGLAEAKDAVEALERGESIDISGMRVQASREPVRIAVNGDVVKKAAFGIGGSILGIFVLTALLVGGILIFVFSSISRTVNKAVSGLPTPATPVRPGDRDPKSIATETLKFGGEGIGAGKFKDNRTIAVAPDGTIFSADLAAGRIQAFTPEGAFKSQINADTSKSVDSLAIDRKGTLWVLQGYDVNRYDANSGEKLGTTRVDMATDLALAADGRMFVGSRYAEIAVLGSDGVKQRSIKIGKDIGIERMSHLAVDGLGNMFIYNDRNSAIYKLAPDGKLVTRFGGKSESPNSDGERFTTGTRDLAVDSQGRLYVAQVSYVSIFSGDGNFVNSFRTSQTFGITLDANDTVFTASRPNVVVYKLSF